MHRGIYGKEGNNCVDCPKLPSCLCKAWLKHTEFTTLIINIWQQFTWKTLKCPVLMGRPAAT